MSYILEEGERDLIIMRHDIGIEWPDRTTEKRAVDLVVYGQPHGYSAMAATVGYPTGIATKMVLEGKCSIGLGVRGVVIFKTAHCRIT